MPCSAWVMADSLQLNYNLLLRCFDFGIYTQTQKLLKLKLSENNIDPNCEDLQTDACNKTVIKISKPNFSN